MMLRVGWASACYLPSDTLIMATLQQNTLLPLCCPWHQLPSGKPSLLLLLLLFIFLISDRFLVLSINPSFSVFGMMVVCVLPSISVGLFLSTYLSGRYLSFSISSKIWDLAFSLGYSSVCLNFSALQMAACFSSRNEASASNSAIFSFSSSTISLTGVFPRELLDDLVFEELEDFLELLPDDVIDELLLDLDLLSSSTSLIQLYIFCFWVSTTSSTVSNQSSSSLTTSCGSKTTQYLCKDTNSLNWSLN